MRLKEDMLETKDDFMPRRNIISANLIEGIARTYAEVFGNGKSSFIDFKMVSTGV